MAKQPASKKTTSASKATSGRTAARELINMPTVKLGVVGVSRDCFPVELTRRRLSALLEALKAIGVEATAAETIIESETDAVAAHRQLTESGCNAAVVFLGNFGPEGPTTQFIQRFSGPVMVCAAAEENKTVLANERGDALCGLLNCSYSLSLRRLRTYIPQHPVGLADELAPRIMEFVSIARVAIGVRGLKVFSFGPRPHDFLACNAPIQGLYDLGVEVMENSELDLYELYHSAAGDNEEIDAVATEMSQELGSGNIYPDLLPKLAQYEVALLRFFRENLGSSRYGVLANKCWPAFEHAFGFVPCYVNGRLAGRGIPVACEVDLYGGLSEYMVQLATGQAATLLDINNSVPADVLPAGADLKGATPADLFMGFHCGNTTSSCMKNCSMNYQIIMNRLMEGGAEPDITRGTLEGQLRPGPMTLFRLQSTPDCHLLSYVAQGDLLDIDPCSFGGIGIIAIAEFARFYRHVLVGRHFPHHAAVGFDKAGKVLVEAVKLLGVDDVTSPLPGSMLYPGENIFAHFED